MKHNRQSIRLKGYNYAQAGLYFITICTYAREHLFGEVVNKKMVLNDAGEVAAKCWREIPVHFPIAILHEYVIMPDHVHGIIELQPVFAGANHNSPIHKKVFRSPSQSIGSIIRGFKIGVTKWFRYESGFPTDTKVWHRNYYDRIIRNEAAYDRIANYIVNNPAKWSEKPPFK